MSDPWQGIVKVQRSIVTTEPNQQYLVYDETHTILYQGDLLESIERLFQPNELKFYAKVNVEHGILHVQHRVPTQPW